MKITNRRTVVFVAVALMLGIFIGGLSFDNLILIIAIPIAFVAVGMIFYFGFKKLLLCAIFIAVALGSAAFSIDCAVNFDGAVTGQHYVAGRVASVGERYAVVDSLTFDGVKHKGKARVNIVQNVSVGDTVDFIGTVETFDFDIFDTYSCLNFNDKIYYEAETDKINVTGNKLKFFEKLKRRITAPIYRFMDTRDAGIAVSLLFGDKSGLSEADGEIINGIGLSHVFAVSGLHVGFLTALIIFILKKLRARPVTMLVFTVAALVVYGFLTGFPAGIKRAAIMSVIYMLAPFVRRKSDPLSALSAASFLILIFNPRELFDLSFIMSVSAVLGIIVFWKPIYNGLSGKRRNPIKNYICGGVATTVSANLFLLPVCFNVFNGVAVYAIIGNLLILPLVTIAYSMTAMSALLVAISPSKGFLYYLAQFPIISIRVLARFIYSLPYAKISVGGMGAATACYLVAIIICTPIIQLDKKIKLICVSLLTAVGISIAVFL